MRLEDMKVGNCENCGSDMPIFNRTQRFCSNGCKNASWIRKRAEKREAQRRAHADKLGFGVAAE